MPASLKFESASGTAATGLSDIKLVTLEDASGNKYTLNIEGGAGNDALELGYQAKGSLAATTHTITGLATALGSLLGAKEGVKSLLVHELGKALSGAEADYDGSGDATDDKTALDFLVGKGKLITEGNLKTEVVKADVVKAIVGSSDFTGAVYTKQAANAGFATKTDLAAKVDLDATNLDNAKVSAMLEKLQDKVVQVSDLPTEVEKPAVAAKILGAKDGAKFVLVDELGKALSGAAADYNKDGNNVTPADFLGPKGMQGPTGLTGPAGLRGQAGAGSGAINATDPDFTAAVREVVSSDYISDNPAYWDF